MYKIVLILICATGIILNYMPVFAKESSMVKEKSQEMQKPDAKLILKNAGDTIYPENYLIKIELENIKPGRPMKIYQLEVYRKGSEKTLAVIKSPANERGQKILRVDDNLWMYFPNIHKSIRIGSRDKILGTDFNQAEFFFDFFSKTRRSCA